MNHTNSIRQTQSSPWEIVIGLEIHAQVISKSKLFSGAPIKFSSLPNTQVNFFDMAMPGTLPVLNKHCVLQAVKTGLAMNCQIHSYSSFARKNYFYPDLPSGYQISQFDLPIVGDGFIYIDLPDNTNKKIGIERIHLEQDAGKLMHDPKSDITYIDLNRAGIALMEIVSKPDMNTADEAIAYITKIRNILRYIQACDGNMQEGSLRADVNISVNKHNEPLGTRCEIKNINSFKFIKQAILYESKRQISLLESGQKLTQHTRLFDPQEGVTRSMRSKENAQDYRYFQDPDLPPLIIEHSFIEKIRKSLPELPDQKYQRFINTYEIAPYDSQVLVSEKEYADYFEQVLSYQVNPKITANWIISELFARLNKRHETIKQAPHPEHFAQLIQSIQNNIISGKIGKTVLDIMCAEKKGANAIIQEHQFSQISDHKTIDRIIDRLIQNHPDQISKLLAGKASIFEWFIGQVMRETKGKANPKMLNQLLHQKINQLKQ